MGVCMLTPGVSDLISKILNTDPRKRYTVAQVRNHSWYRNCHFITDPDQAGNYYDSGEMLHEDVLRYMVVLGYDPQVIVNSVLRRKYDHFDAAYHFLLYRKLQMKSKQSGIPPNVLSTSSTKSAEFTRDKDVIKPAPIKIKARASSALGGRTRSTNPSPTSSVVSSNASSSEAVGNSPQQAHGRNPDTSGRGILPSPPVHARNVQPSVRIKPRIPKLAFPKDINSYAARGHSSRPVTAVVSSRKARYTSANGVARRIRPYREQKSNHVQASDRLNLFHKFKVPHPPSSRPRQQAQTARYAHASRKATFHGRQAFTPRYNFVPPRRATHIRQVQKVAEDPVDLRTPFLAPDTRTSRFRVKPQIRINAIASHRVQHDGRRRRRIKLYGQYTTGSSSNARPSASMRMVFHNYF